jgi:hypothetical protein
MRHAELAAGGRRGPGAFSRSPGPAPARRRRPAQAARRGGHREEVGRGVPRQHGPGDRHREGSREEREQDRHPEPEPQPEAERCEPGERGEEEVLDAASVDTEAHRGGAPALRRVEGAVPDVVDHEHVGHERADGKADEKGLQRQPLRHHEAAPDVVRPRRDLDVVRADLGHDAEHQEEERIRQTQAGITQPAAGVGEAREHPDAADHGDQGPTDPRQVQPGGDTQGEAGDGGSPEHVEIERAARDRVQQLRVFADVRVTPQQRQVVREHPADVDQPAPEQRQQRGQAGEHLVVDRKAHGHQHRGRCRGERVPRVEQEPHPDLAPRRRHAFPHEGRHDTGSSVRHGPDRARAGDEPRCPTAVVRITSPARARAAAAARPVPRVVAARGAIARPRAGPVATPRWGEPRHIRHASARAGARAPPEPCSRRHMPCTAARYRTGSCGVARRIRSRGG